MVLVELRARLFGNNKCWYDDKQKWKNRWYYACACDSRSVLPDTALPNGLCKVAQHQECRAKGKSSYDKPKLNSSKNPCVPCLRSEEIWYKVYSHNTQLCFRHIEFAETKASSSKNGIFDCSRLLLKVF